MPLTLCRPLRPGFYPRRRPKRSPPTYRVEVRRDDDGLPQPWHGRVMMVRDGGPAVTVHMTRDCVNAQVAEQLARAWLARKGLEFKE